MLLVPKKWLIEALNLKKTLFWALIYTYKQKVILKILLKVARAYAVFFNIFLLKITTQTSHIYSPLFCTVFL